MNLLPLVNRELRTAVRRRRSYRIRMTSAGASILVSFWAMLVWGGWAAGATLGITLLHALAQAGFIGALLAGVSLTADAVSQEKRDATLGLLWVTGLKPHELVLGKLAGKIVVPFYALIGMLPGFAVSSVVGGVAGGEFWRLLAVLLNTLFWSLAAGLLASSFCQQQRTAYSSAVLLMLLGAAGFPLLGQWLVSWLGNPVWADLAGLFSPTGSYQFAFDQRYSTGSLWFWGSLACTNLFAWLSLGFAAGFIAYYSYIERDFVMRHRFSPATPGTPVPPCSTGDSPGQESDRLTEIPARSAVRIDAARAWRRSLENNLRDSNPIAWLASRRRSRSLLIWFPIAVAFWLLLTSDLSPLGNARSKVNFFLWCAIHFLFQVWMAGDAAHTFVNDRRTGALELLLGTPLEIREIAAGMLRALRLRFVRPALALFALDVLLAFRFIGSNDLVSGLLVFVGAVLFLLGSYSVLWVGIWQAMVSPHPAMATLNGAVRILLLPWVWFGIVAGLFTRSSLVELTLAWAVLAGLNSLVFFRGARHRLYEHFRVLALKPYGEKPPHIESDWSAINWEAEEQVEVDFR